MAKAKGGKKHPKPVLTELVLISLMKCDLNLTYCFLIGTKGI